MCTQTNEKTIVKKQELVEAFPKSISENALECTNSLLEIGIDSLMEDGLLKDVPFISTTVSLYKIGHSISERHHISKMISFINSINSNAINDAQREKYINLFLQDKNKRKKEIDYLIIIIDRYIGLEKPKMLAKLYLAYLEGIITWGSLTSFSEVIDRLIPGDYERLLTDPFYNNFFDYEGSLLRLSALGLLKESGSNSVFEKNNGHYTLTTRSMRKQSRGEKDYIKTEFGKTFIEIMKKYQ